jgi:hypothetical protein
METEKTRYSDEELEEFRTIINEKLALAKRDYNLMMASITNQDSNDVDDSLCRHHPHDAASGGAL